MARARREQVWERANGCCEYCQMPQQLDVRPFQLDHVRAQKHRGPSGLNNAALACLPCNSYKGPNIAGYDPELNRLQRLFNPRLDDWHEHFEWVGAVLAGKTAIGRTTIEVLRINAPDRVAHRNLLIGGGVFPPVTDD
jgi:hypothetical protein